MQLKLAITVFIVTKIMLTSSIPVHFTINSRNNNDLTTIGNTVDDWASEFSFPFIAPQGQKKETNDEDVENATKVNTNGSKILPRIDEAVLCSLLGRCIKEKELRLY